MWLRSRYPLVASRDEHCEENSQRYSHRGVGMPPNPSAPASIFFQAVVIWCTRAVGARSSLELLPIERLRASVSVIRAMPLGMGSKLAQLRERPSRPFTPRAGPAWPARILEAGVIYHVKEELVYLGVDIAKSYLEAAVGNEKRRFSNERIGHRELIKWVKQIKAPGQVICESSGGYERAFVQRLARARVKISLVQANRVRQFARAAGILAKTDRIDAELLCSFGKVMRPQTVTAAKLEQEHLRELESQRRHLTHLLVMELNRGRLVSDASVQRLNRS